MRASVEASFSAQLITNKVSTYTSFLDPVKLILEQSFRVLVYPLHVILQRDGPLAMLHRGFRLLLPHLVLFA